MVKKVRAGRMSPEKRTAMLLDIAYNLGDSKGLHAVTRAAVARVAVVSEPLVNRYFKGTDGLCSQVITMAAEKKNTNLLASAAREGWDVSTLGLSRNYLREVRRAAG